MLDAFNRLFNNSTSRDFAMAVQVFNTSANEYACTHSVQRRYNSIYENRRDFNQRETPLINAARALRRGLRSVSALKNQAARWISRANRKRRKNNDKKARAPNARRFIPPNTLIKRSNRSA